MKMKQNMAREEYIRSIQAKAAAEREERRMKLSRSKKLINDHRKAAAELKKEESKKLVEIAQTGKVMTEFEKRKKADEERKRCVSQYPSVLPIIAYSSVCFKFQLGEIKCEWSEKESGNKKKRKFELLILEKLKMKQENVNRQRI